MYAPVVALVAGGLVLLLLSACDFDVPRKAIVGVLILTAVVGGLVVLGNLFLLIGLLAAALGLGGAGGIALTGAEVGQLQSKLEQARLTRVELQAELARIQARLEALTKELTSRFLTSQRQVAAELATTQ